MPKLILSQQGGETPVAFDLNPGLNRLGRNPTNDFRIGDASISSFHCEITVSTAGITVKDLGSTNGTFVESKPVSESVLIPGQKLQLGSVEMVLSTDEAPLPHVAIPDLSVPVAATPNKLPDGAAACLHHPGVAAVHACQKCGGVFCDSCVRTLRRSGGATMIFCLDCSGPCNTINVTAPTKKKAGLLGKLTQTLKLTFKR